MEANYDKISELKRKVLVKYPRFGSDIAGINIVFKDDLEYHTAATDGDTIYIDPNFFEKLSEDELIFVIAHEILHIKFMHMYRLKDKDGNMRDPKLWNEATDAIINANLERDGFEIIEGAVNRPEALEYTAEEYYEVLKQKQQQGEEIGQQNQDECNESGSRGEHTLWEEAYKEKEEGKKKNSQNKNGNEQENKFNEKDEFSQNRKEKIKRFKNMRNETQKKIRTAGQNNTEILSIGESKKKIDWKFLLKRELDKTETIWTQRRSIAENNYAYRLEENDIEDEAETEVIIDVSGSVDREMVRGFLRQVKSLLNHSKLKVGFFDDMFYDFQEVKTKKEIDRMVIPGGGGTDIDLAARSFSKKREVNKIVFTDGYGETPGDDLKRENIIWVVYGNDDFDPCCGKVITIDYEQLERMYMQDDNNNIKEKAEALMEKRKIEKAEALTKERKIERDRDDDEGR